MTGSVDLFCGPAALLHDGCEDHVENAEGEVDYASGRDSELQSGKHGTSRRLLLRL